MLFSKKTRKPACTLADMAGEGYLTTETATAITKAFAENVESVQAEGATQEGAA